MRSLSNLGLCFVLFSVLTSYLRAASTMSTATKVIAKGTEFVQEYVSDTLAVQASGEVRRGCSLSNLKDCFTIKLDTSGQDFSANRGSNDPSDRQRAEFLTNYTEENNGQSRKYEWTSFIDSSFTIEKSQWVHFWQIVSDSGPVVQQTGIGDEVSVRIKAAQARKKGQCSQAMSLKQFTGQTFQHSMSVTYGPEGSVRYTMKDTKGSTKMTCNYSGFTGNGKTYLKMGVYRSVASGMPPVSAVIGGFQESKSSK